jgi:hypothetical protein
VSSGRSNWWCVGRRFLGQWRCWQWWGWGEPWFGVVWFECDGGFECGIEVEVAIGMESGVEGEVEVVELEVGLRVQSSQGPVSERKPRSPTFHLLSQRCEVEPQDIAERKDKNLKRFCQNIKATK